LVPINRKAAGLLYQWSAAMNQQTAERSQGACPTGWHVPSDCEFMFLENTLGMSVSDQQIRGEFTTTTTRGADVKIGQLLVLPSGNPSGYGTNKSGYTILIGGFSTGDANGYNSWTSDSRFYTSTLDPNNTTNYSFNGQFPFFREVSTGGGRFSTGFG